MASIKPYKLKSGALRYEVFVSNGLDPGTQRQRKIHKKGFKTHDEALQFAKITEGNIASGEHYRLNPQKMTIENFFDLWIDEYKKDVKEGTRIIHRENIDRYIKPYIGKFQLDQYKRMNHQKYINDLLTLKGHGKSKQGLAISTVKTINATVSNAFKKAIQLELVKTDPTAHTEFPREKIEKESLKYYDFEQVERFIRLAKKEASYVWPAFFLLVFEAGLRRSEVLGLEWRHIDFSKNEVTIEQQRLGKAELKENAGSIAIDEVKSPSSNRVLPLTNNTKTALLELRNRILRQFGTFPSFDNHAFIFVNTHYRNISLPIRANTASNAFQRIRQRAELPYIKLHDGRHTFAVRLRQAGLSLEDIRDLLGHKDISATQIYAHISPEVQQRSIEKLEDYLITLRKKHS